MVYIDAHKRQLTNNTTTRQPHQFHLCLQTAQSHPQTDVRAPPVPITEMHYLIRVVIPYCSLVYRL